MSNTDQLWQAVNPCPNCGAVPHEAPEGVNIEGNPHWNMPHCYRCGYNPQVNNPTNRAEMQSAFQQFWKDRQTQQGDALSHPSVNADATPITNPYANADQQPGNEPAGDGEGNA